MGLGRRCCTLLRVLLLLLHAEALGSTTTIAIAFESEATALTTALENETTALTVALKIGATSVTTALEIETTAVAIEATSLVKVLGIESTTAATAKLESIGERRGHTLSSPF